MLILRIIQNLINFMSIIQLFQMQNNRHTAEIRELLHKKKLSRSRFNPQSRIVSHNYPLKQSRPMKRSESSTSLQQKNIELQCIQRRYRDLHQSYIQIADQTKKKVQLCKKHEEEIQKYEKAKERDRKQIQRLRAMLGFVQKVNKQTQTQASDATNKIQCQYQYESREVSRGNSSTKKQRRPLQNKSQLINKSELFSKNSRILQRSSSGNKQSRLKQHNNDAPTSNTTANGQYQYLQKMKKYSNTHELIKSQKNINVNMKFKEEGLRQSQSRIRSPLQRYKFVPSLQFQ